MNRPSRFARTTAGLDLNVLLSPLRKSFWLSIGIALLLNAILVLLYPFQQQAEKAPRPLTTKFVKRQPRLTKALELRKIPQRKRPMIRRQVHAAAARMDQVQATAAFSTRAIIARSTGIANMLQVGQSNSQMLQAVLEPVAGLTANVEISRASEHKIDMGLEMLDVDAMDTGRYRALVIQDPNDKQGLKGFVKFARVVSATYMTETQTNVVDGGLNNREIDILCDMLNEWTGLRAEFVGSFTFDDNRFLSVPIVIPQGEPNENELENLARYLLAGGFVMAEQFDFEGFWTEALEKYGGLIKGRDFYTERLREDHPIFTAYFDLGDGVAQGASRFDDPYYWNVVKGCSSRGDWWRCPGPTRVSGGIWALPPNAMRPAYSSLRSTP